MNPSGAPKARPNQIADETIDELKDDIQKGKGEFSREQLARKFRGEALQKQTELEDKGIDTSELSDTEVIARHFEENLAFIPSYISIKELSDQGAAGLCNVVSNRVWLDEGILNLGMTRKKDEHDKQYWMRVIKHEEVHRNKQAARFDKNYVQWDDRIIPLVALLEGEAIEENLQEDLTPEYKKYQAMYTELERFVGRKALNVATHDGKVSYLQEAIDMKMARNKTGHPPLSEN